MLNPDIRGALSSETKGSAALHETAVGVLAAPVVATVHMPQPLYIARAKRSRVWDVDGREYIDLTMGFGTHLLGHAGLRRRSDGHISLASRWPSANSPTSR